ncbi:MAG: phosphoribosyl-AMP cyclohydrolase [Terriglobales bacterium]|jgi:phosphoribosyl-AMP cyclohydrolase
MILKSRFFSQDQEGSMEIDFDKMQGLVPAVIQDAGSGELLMVGFMNREALDMTLHTGFVTFYSRTRRTLWTKGETSGNRLQVVAAWTDCDRDTVLLRVHVLGEGKVCHTGTRSCFMQELPLGSALVGQETDRQERAER